VDKFYQELRQIQKKERNNGTLARVEEDFYTKLHEYMDVLKKEAMSDPFSKAVSLLKQSQIIATEICERREKKISEAAVVNIHRSYHLFTGKPQFDLVDTTPLNLTPEEEKFYYSLIDTLKNHRSNISLEKLSDDDEKPKKPIIKPKETQKTTLTPEVDVEKAEPNPIIEEKIEPEASPEIKPAEKPKAKPKPTGNIEDNPNAFDANDEFYDFESKKVAKDMELVTMLVFDDVGAIVGVDEKTYGPFRPQDIVTLPLVNAKIFFKNRKGRQVKI
jgi:DNA replication factor GINS